MALSHYTRPAFSTGRTARVCFLKSEGLLLASVEEEGLLYSKRQMPRHAIFILQAAKKKLAVI